MQLAVIESKINEQPHRALVRVFVFVYGWLVMVWWLRFREWERTKKEVSNDINMLKIGWVRCDSYIYNHFVFTRKRLSECHQFNHVASIGNQCVHLLILHCCRGSYALLPTDLIWAQKPSERKNQNGCQRLDQKDEPCQLMATWPFRIFGMPLVCIEMDGFVIIIKPFQKTPVVLTSMWILSPLQGALRRKAARSPWIHFI